MAELWDLYTAEREPINQTGERGTILPKTQFHTIIHAWIKRKSDGKFLVSQRVPDIFWGGYWQPTGGSAVHGETSLQAAMRECKEELGLNLANAKSSFLFSYRYAPPVPQNPSFFLDAWLFTIEGETDQIEMQKSEVADFAWLTFDQIIELWQNGKFMPFEQTWPPYFNVLKMCLAAPQRIKSLKFWAASLLQYFDYQQKYEQPNSAQCEYFADEQNKNPNAQLDAALILAHSLNCNKSELLLKAEETVELPVIEKFEKLLYQRLNGKAVAYLIEEKDFYFYSFYVTPAVLIPKPDTELLIEKAFDQIIDFWREDRTKKLAVLDLCCGSGCIGISVYKRLKEFLCYCHAQLLKAGKKTAPAAGTANTYFEPAAPNPDDDYFFKPAYKKLFAGELTATPSEPNVQTAQNTQNAINAENTQTVQLPVLPQMFFSDISPEALTVAKINAKRLLPQDFANFTFFQGDLLEPFLQSRQNGTAFSFDLLLTNPPYVPTNLTNSLLADGRGEPRLALDGGKDGLDLIERIIGQVWTVLNLNGIIFAETGEYNATQTAELLIGKGFAQVEIFKDMTDQLRLVKAKKIGRSKNY